MESRDLFTIVEQELNLTDDIDIHATYNKRVRILNGENLNS